MKIIKLTEKINQINTSRKMSEEIEATCSDFEEMLDLYQDEELPPNVQLRLSNHYENCAECKKTAKIYRWIRDVASDLESPEMPDKAKIRLNRFLKTLEPIH